MKNGLIFSCMLICFSCAAMELSEIQQAIRIHRAARNNNVHKLKDMSEHPVYIQLLENPVINGFARGIATEKMTKNFLESLIKSP